MHISILLRERLRTMEILRLPDQGVFHLRSLVLPLTSFDAFGQSLNCSMPQFPHLRGGDKMS